MPELPEVETIRRQLEDRFVGGRITACDILNPSTCRTPQFDTHVVGRQMTRFRRRGKYLIIDLDNEGIVIHLRMSGAFVESQTIHTRCALHTDKGSLYFHDPRKFGTLIYSACPDNLVSHLGPEPLSEEFTPELLAQKLQSSRRIKAVLLDQSKVAGLGNIYVDEALWRSKIHPLTPSCSVDNITELHQAIQYVLTRGIETKGTSLGSGKSNYQSLEGPGHHQTHLDVYQRTNQPCLRCQTPIEKIRVAQRGTHYCPRCQCLT